MGIWYISRETVMASTDIKATAYAASQIDSAIESASRNVDSLLHRNGLAPWTGTRSFDWPGDQNARSWRLWLGPDELISLTSIANNDGTTISAANAILEPQDGPPYDRIETNTGTSAAFSSGSTWQRAVSVTGVFGYSTDELLAGTTAEVLDAVETGVDGSAMPSLGVGSVIRVDTERMIVTDRTWLSTGQTGSLTASNAAQTLAVSDGTVFLPGETLILDAERLVIVDITGNNLIVRRATDGSTLAVHTTATVYAQRLLTVQRGALGTTAATHLTAAPVYEWQPPALAAELALAYALNSLEQRKSAYARTVGEGENEQEAGGRGIREIEADARAAMARMARTAGV